MKIIRYIKGYTEEGDFMKRMSRFTAILIMGILVVSTISLNVLANNEVETNIIAYGNDTRYASAGISIAFANYYNSIDSQEASVESEEKVKLLVSNEIVSVVSEYTKLGVANVTNYLNVREEPNEGAKLLGKLPMNAGCEILEEINGWYKIQSGNVIGYVSGEFLLTGEEANLRATEAMITVATVTADQLRIRTEPNTDSSVVARIASGEELEVVGVVDGWVEVNLTNTRAYVSAEFVVIHDTLPKGVTLQELSYGGSVSNTVVDLIQYAKQFLGNPYVYGGTSLTNGTDCSGFTMRVFAQFGYTLNRSSAAQSNNGFKISLSEIKPGDLLFYSYGGSIGHVALYIGNGQIIHASTEKTGIIISNAFYSTPTCAVRIIN